MRCVELQAPKDSLAIFGAAGSVAGATLHYLPELYNGPLVVGDIKQPEMPKGDEDCYTRVTKVQDDFGSFNKADWLHFFRDQRVKTCVDLANLGTLSMSDVCSSAGVNYLNAGLVDDRELAVAYGDVLEARDRNFGSTQVFFSGMNPGVVNTWVGGVRRRFGDPQRVTFFEYDSSLPLDNGKPTINWSPAQFAVEAGLEPGGEIDDEGKVRRILPTALEEPTPLSSYLKGIGRLNGVRPWGIKVFHEELVTLDGIPSRFVYGLHPKTMDYVMEIYRKNGHLEADDLRKADNRDIPLSGSDLIGVQVEFGNFDVFQFNEVSNEELRGVTTSTCHQVASGVLGGIAEINSGRMGKRIYFPEELGHVFQAEVDKRLVVHERIVAK